ncbi:MAG: putative molybdenum carrier protein [Thermodesulfobacteriota bacterium]
MGVIFSKIISGGQTGVDRAALDAALELGIPCGGWCPKGRRAEDGPISLKYPLSETGSPNYPLRTEKNVREADGTCILTNGPLRGGTALTVRFAVELEKPYLIIDLNDHFDPPKVREWGEKNNIKTLNVAGPRESEAPGIHEKAFLAIKSFLHDKGEKPVRKLKILFG